MGEDITIESIAIEITAAADEADRGISELVKKLEELKAVCQSGLSGASKVAGGIKKIAEAAQSFNGIDGEKIRNIASALESLQNISAAPDLSGYSKGIAKLADAVNSANSVDVAAFAQNIQSVTSALEPLKNMPDVSGLSSATSALSKLPKIEQGLSKMDISSFAKQMKDIASAIQPFTTQMNSLAASFANMPEPVQRAVSALANYTQQTEQAENRSQKLSLKLFNVMTIITGLKKIKNTLDAFITSSNDYVENLNLFVVSMGEAADEAMRFAEEVNDVMGIDISEWIQSQGYFKQLVSGFGMIEEKANLVSQNMTQLGYDISSYFNISVEDSMAKLQSGISGELEPLRRIGYALDAATLQQVAYNHGIEMNINNMSQAQKAQIRYIAIMEQSKNVMGDMARTIESPTNQLRILESRIETLKRAIGDSLMPVISAVLPYVTAFVQILGETFRAIAEFMGFELPVFDYSDTVSKNNADIADSFDDATKASEKFKGSLASIDQLNIIGSKTSSGGKGNQFGEDLDLELPSYDFLGDLKKETSEAYNALKSLFENALPWIEVFGIALGSAFAVKKVSGFITGLSNVKTALAGLAGANSEKVKKNISGIAGGLAAGASSGVLFYNGIKNLVKGTGNLANNWVQVGAGVGIASTAIGLFVKMSNPIGAVITAVGALTGVIVGLVSAQKELDNELAKTITFADNGGISVSALADGFSSYFDTVSSGYDKILDNSEAMKQNREKIAEAAGEVKNITDKFIALDGEISSEDFQKIKTSIKDIGDAVKENLGEGIQTLVDQLTGKFRTFADTIGGGADELTTKLYVLQNMGNTALAKYQQRMEEYAAVITSKEASKEEKKDAFAGLNEVSQILASAASETPESVSFKRAVADVMNGKINLEDENAVKSAIANISDSAKQARETIQTAWDASMADFENTKQFLIASKVDVEFDAEYGEGSFKKMVDEIEATLNAGYKSELSKIDVGEQAGLGMISKKLDEKANAYAKNRFDQYGVGFGSRWETWFNHGGATATDEMYKAIALKNYKNAYFETEAIKPIKEALGSALDGVDVAKAEETAELFMQGMVNGTIKRQEDLDNAISTIAISGIDTLRKEWEIRSPSKKAESISEYFMLGLINGFTENKQKLYEVIDEIASKSSSKMEKLKVFSPHYSSEDVSSSFSNTGVMGYATGTYMSSVQHGGADSQTVSQVGQAWNEGGTPIEVNVNANVSCELDGDKIGETSYRYNQRQMAYTNGY